MDLIKLLCFIFIFPRCDDLIDELLLVKLLIYQPPAWCACISQIIQTYMDSLFVTLKNFFMFVDGFFHPFGIVDVFYYCHFTSHFGSIEHLFLFLIGNVAIFPKHYVIVKLMVGQIHKMNFGPMDNSICLVGQWRCTLEGFIVNHNGVDGWPYSGLSKLGIYDLSYGMAWPI